MGNTSFCSRKGFVVALIIFCSLLAYANSLRGTFIWDDRNLIADNDNIKSWSNLAKNLSTDFFQQTEKGANPGSYYRPLINLSYMVDYSLWGENTLGYHLTNLIWHIASGIIIYFLTLRLFKQENLALITALLFAVHPIHTESVSWISGRTDVICGFFFFAALYFYCLGSLGGEKKFLYQVVSW